MPLIGVALVPADAARQLPRGPKSRNGGNLWVRLRLLGFWRRFWPEILVS